MTLRMIPKITIETIFILLTIWSPANHAKMTASLGSIPLAQNQNLAFLPEVPTPEILVSRPQYVLSYNSQKRVPNWVSWTLVSQNIGPVVRTNNFEVDIELDTYLKNANLPRAVKPSEFDGSCFDRGHQVPSKDRTDLAQNNQATFTMSNMLPQTPYLNRVLWEHLESYTRERVQKLNKKYFIIAGPIVDDNLGAIGPQEDIQVPSKNFKIIFFLDPKQSAADITPKTEKIFVIMPNTLANGDRAVAGSFGENCQIANMLDASGNVTVEIPNVFRFFVNRTFDASI